jgi:predicted GNAT superfamily acetyltransferase
LAEKKVTIRALDTQGDFDRLLDIQRAVWKHPDADLTPAHQFCVSSRMGAILLGAFVGRELAGFVYSFPAVFHGRACQHSHLLAVLPEFQGYGLGKALKWAQREEAVKRGYDLLTWTFDPLQTRNANLNLQALGAVSRAYFPNFYGLTPALCLGPGIPTDRLLIEWPIRAGRVKGRAEAKAKRPCHDPERLPKALERRAGAEGTFAPPGRPRLDLEDPVLLVEVPRDIKALAFRCDLIAAWQANLRRVLQHYFDRGWVADHFIFGDRAFYVLKRPGRKR